MWLYSENKNILINSEELIHEQRKEIESNYKCRKWANILKHILKNEFALYVDNLAIELTGIPEDCELLNKLPSDFYPGIEEIL